MKKLLFVTIIIFFSVVISFNFLNRSEYFTRLSESFMRGKTYFLIKPYPDWMDTTLYKGKYYSPHGPLPAVFLIPFAYFSNIFNFTFYQSYLQPILVACVFYFTFKISRNVKYNYDDSLFLAFAFCFSTVFLGSALWPDFLAHTLVSLFLLLLIYANLVNTPIIFSGILVGLLLLTRASALGVLSLPLLSIIFVKKATGLEKIKLQIIFLIPIIVAFLTFCLYNWVRFGNVFEYGYTNAINLVSATKAREYGVLNYHHIPGNLYYFLLAVPLPVFKDNLSHVLKFPFIRANPWGLSIFITSPIFIYLFSLSYKDKLSKILIATILAVATPIFLYYGIGARQMGYRYSLDFLPFLFFLMIKNYKEKFKKLSNNFKLVVLFSSISNLYFFLTAYLFP